MLYKRIFIPTDGSDAANKAVTHALSLAEALNAEIYAIYVIDVSAFAGLPAEAEWENMKNLLRAESDAAMEHIERKADAKGIKFKRIVKEGVPAEEIVKTAKEIRADLIVMGNSGRTGLDKFLLGSVVEKIIRTSPCPVLVVHK